MEKNYYELLEVDKKASPEVIKKAYSTLAKKYHPDLYPEDLKHVYEEKFKLINEAYEVLSNSEKRTSYDTSLFENTISKKDYDAICFENERLKNIIQKLQNESSLQNMNDTSNTSYNASREDASSVTTNTQAEQQNYYKDYMDNIEQARQQAYYDAYVQDLKNKGYKIKYKKTLKDYLKNLIALIFTIIILFLLCQIPFVKNILIDMYNENSIFKSFVNTISNLFK